MSQPRSDIAWMLVRKATGLTDDDVVTATGVHRNTLAQMRQRHTEMVEAGTASRQSWSLDQLPFTITHMEDTGEAEVE